MNEQKDNTLQIAQLADNTKKDLVQFAKSKVFDVLGILLIVAMMALILGVFTKRDLDWETLQNILLEVIPFYFAALLLSTIYYKKGCHNGKLTNAYLTSVAAFSELVSQMTGSLLEYLSDFCDVYNEKALRKRQKEILKSQNITLERFLNDELNEDGSIKRQALCRTPFTKLYKTYGLNFALTVFKAIHVKIKQISTNKLLGNLNAQDDTDIGANESQMTRKRTASYALTTVLTIFFLTFITVKNILEWGWISLIFMSFKIIFVAVNSYMKYFHGYDDVTIRLVNHYNRKSDILKQCIYSYNPME